MKTGYGISTDSLSWNQDHTRTLLRRISLGSTPKSYKKFTDWHSENAEEDETEEDAFDRFLCEYENDTYYWSEFEGFLADVLTETSKTQFRYEDCCIYVEPTLPYSRDDSVISQVEIAATLKFWLEPLVDDPSDIKIGWLDIHDVC